MISRFSKTDWTAIPSKITAPSSLDGLPAVVRNFYLLSQVISNAPVCCAHKQVMLMTHVETLATDEYSEISDFCRPHLHRRILDRLSPFKSEETLGKPLRWVEVLSSKWPLAASTIPQESIQLLMNDYMWQCMLVGCSECMELSGESLEDLVQRLTMSPEEL